MRIHSLKISRRQHEKPKIFFKPAENSRAWIDRVNEIQFFVL